MNIKAFLYLFLENKAPPMWSSISNQLQRVLPMRSSKWLNVQRCSRWFIAKQRCHSMNIQPVYWDCRNDSKGKRAALFSQTRGIEVQRASFLSCLVALCTSRFIIALLNEGYDIPPPLYWQDLDSFPVQKSIIHNKISCLQTRLMHCICEEQRMLPHIWI